MRMNQKTRLVMAMAFSVASSTVLAQEAAVFSNLVTCTNGKCRAGDLVYASVTSTQNGAGCAAYGIHKVTIGFNGETQTVKVVCSGGSDCVGDALANVGGRDFLVSVFAGAQGHGNSLCERWAEGAHTE